MPFPPKRIFFLLLLIFFRFHAFTQVNFTSSDLPIVVINTGTSQIGDEPKIYATMGIIWNGAGQRNTLDDPMNDFNGIITIEKRGSSSQMFPKKSYGFETKTADLADLDVSLLGMPEENTWILYAPYTDKTMIRDVLSYTLDASLGNYSPRCRYVELVVNDRYDGVYVLMEKIKRDKNRVDIAKLTDTDNEGENLTGGYIIKIDKETGNSGGGWFSDYANDTRNTYYQYDYPKYDEITPEQETYIQTYVKAMEEALYLQKFSGVGSYHEYLNDSSFIDFMIINELAKNIDGYRLSSYLYKDKNDVLNCGPIWDFNLTYGNANYLNGWSPTGFQYMADLTGDGWQNPFWWNMLIQDPSYSEKLKKRWATLRQNELSNQQITFVADSLVNVIYEAQVRNYERWPILGIYVWPNAYVGRDYASEVDWMKNWIDERLDFLDKQWPYDFTGNEEQMASQTVTIFPNPFTDRLSIQLASEMNGNGYFELYNSGGSLVRKNDVNIFNGQIQLEFSGDKSLTPGIYILRIINNNKVLLTEKVAKTL